MLDYMYVAAFRHEPYGHLMMIGVYSSDSLARMAAVAEYNLTVDSRPRLHGVIGRFVVQKWATNTRRMEGEAVVGSIAT